MLFSSFNDCSNYFDEIISLVELISLTTNYDLLESDENEPYLDPASLDTSTPVDHLHVVDPKHDLIHVPALILDHLQIQTHKLISVSH